MRREVWGVEPACGGGVRSVGRGRGRGWGDSGSTLLLVPAATMVVLALAAIAVDLSMLHAARRDLVAAAGRAVDDAVMSLDQAGARRGEFDRLDVVRARRIVEFELAAARLSGPIVDGPRVTAGPGRSLHVEVAIEVDHLFGSAVPGFGGSDRVRVDVGAELVDR